MSGFFESLVREARDSEPAIRSSVPSMFAPTPGLREPSYADPDGETRWQDLLPADHMADGWEGYPESTLPLFGIGQDESLGSMPEEGLFPTAPDLAAADGSRLADPVNGAGGTPQVRTVSPSDSPAAHSEEELNAPKGRRLETATPTSYASQSASVDLVPAERGALPEVGVGGSDPGYGPLGHAKRVDIPNRERSIAASETAFSIAMNGASGAESGPTTVPGDGGRPSIKSDNVSSGTNRAADFPARLDFREPAQVEPPNTDEGVAASLRGVISGGPGVFEEPAHDQAGPHAGTVVARLFGAASRNPDAFEESAQVEQPIAFEEVVVPLSGEESGGFGALEEPARDQAAPHLRTVPQVFSGTYHNLSAAEGSAQNEPPKAFEGVVPPPLGAASGGSGASEEFAHYQAAPYVGPVVSQLFSGTYRDLSAAKGSAEVTPPNTAEGIVPPPLDGASGGAGTSEESAHDAAAPHVGTVVPQLFSGTSRNRSAVESSAQVAPPDTAEGIVPLPFGTASGSSGTSEEPGYHQAAPGGETVVAQLFSASRRSTGAFEESVQVTPPTAAEGLVAPPFGTVSGGSGASEEPAHDAAAPRASTDALQLFGIALRESSAFAEPPSVSNSIVSARTSAAVPATTREFSDAFPATVPSGMTVSALFKPVTSIPKSGHRPEGTPAPDALRGHPEPPNFVYDAGKQGASSHSNASPEARESTREQTAAVRPPASLEYLQGLDDVSDGGVMPMAALTSREIEDRADIHEASRYPGEQAAGSIRFSEPPAASAKAIDPVRMEPSHQPPAQRASVLTEAAPRIRQVAETAWHAISYSGSAGDSKLVEGARLGSGITPMFDSALTAARGEESQSGRVSSESATKRVDDAPELVRSAPHPFTDTDRPESRSAERFRQVNEGSPALPGRDSRRTTPRSPTINGPHDGGGSAKAPTAFSFQTIGHPSVETTASREEEAQSGSPSMRAGRRPVREAPTGADAKPEPPHWYVTGSPDATVWIRPAESPVLPGDQQLRRSPAPRYAATGSPESEYRADNSPVEDRMEKVPMPGVVSADIHRRSGVEPTALREISDEATNSIRLRAAKPSTPDVFDFGPGTPPVGTGDREADAGQVRSLDIVDSTLLNGSVETPRGFERNAISAAISSNRQDPFALHAAARNAELPSRDAAGTFSDGTKARYPAFAPRNPSREQPPDARREALATVVSPIATSSAAKMASTAPRREVEPAFEAMRLAESASAVATVLSDIGEPSGTRLSRTASGLVRDEAPVVGFPPSGADQWDGTAGNNTGRDARRHIAEENPFGSVTRPRRAGVPQREGLASAPPPEWERRETGQGSVGAAFETFGNNLEERNQLLPEPATAILPMAAEVGDRSPWIGQSPSHAGRGLASQPGIGQSATVLPGNNSPAPITAGASPLMRWIPGPQPAPNESPRDIAPAVVPVLSPARKPEPEPGIRLASPDPVSPIHSVAAVRGELRQTRNADQGDSLVRIRIGSIRIDGPAPEAPRRRVRRAVPSFSHRDYREYLKGGGR